MGVYKGIRMLLLFASLLCIIQAHAIPADIKPDQGFDLEETNADGLVNPSDLKPRIYIEPTIRFDNGTDVDDKDMDLDRATTTCGCGYSISNPASGRIVNGKEVSPVHKLPYQVRLQICYTQGCFLCGGTLLNKRYVLSAMHCVYCDDKGWPRNIKAVIGEHNVQHDWETKAKEQAIQVVDIISRNLTEPAEHSGLMTASRCVHMLVELIAAKETVGDHLYFRKMVRILLLVLCPMVLRVVQYLVLQESMPK